jgi:hypothetical protein
MYMFCQLKRSRIGRVWTAEGGLGRAAEGCRGRAAEAGLGAAEGGGGWADRSAVMGHLSPSHTCNTTIMCLIMSYTIETKLFLSPTLSVSRAL